MSSPHAESMDQILDRFDDAWNGPTPPSIEDYLRPCEPAKRFALLVELIRIDLERRLTAGERVRLEEAYLPRFPDLNADPAAIVTLAAREFELRHRSDPNVALAEYMERFPEYRNRILARLPTVDERSNGEPQETTPPVPKVGGLTAGEQWGCYELLQELGRGGMGVVWKARQVTLDRVVALKMILDDRHAGGDALTRFQSEARALARLQHPNIVQIHEVSVHEGHPFFSLEFVEGGSLDRKLQGKPCALRQSARLVETLARAMQAAHEAGIVHRDLKPANVLVAKDWVLKITDFGLAKRLDEVGKTQSGAIMGTPCYMSPEQAAGKVREVGVATDVYALGAILYELLTGRPPFLAATTWETLQKVLTEEPIPLRRLRREIPRDLETICLKCLAKNPAQRYRSALDLADDLERYLAGEAIRARPEGWLRKQRRRARRYRTALLTAMVLVLSLGISAAVVWRNNREQQVVRVQREFLEHLQENDRSPERLAELEDVLTRLEQLSPSQARVSAQQWGEALEGIVRRDLAKPGKLEADEVACIEEILRHLETRDPDRAKVLHEALNRRYRDWAVVLDLQPPFTERTRVFGDAVDLQESRGALWRKLPPEGEKAFIPRVQTRIPCAGDLELEAVFDSSWEKASALALYLNMPPGREEIQALAVSPDGQKVAIGNQRGAVELLDVANGEVRQVLQGHTGPVKALAFLPDGKRLLSGSEDKTVKMWDLSTGKPRQTWIVAKSAFYGFALSPDGRSLATVTDDSLVQLWAVDTPKARPKAFDRKTDWYAGGSYGGIVFSPDGKGIFGAAQHAKCCWDVVTGTVRWFDTKSPSHLVGLAISPDGARLSAMLRDHSLRIHDTADGDWLQIVGRGSSMGSMSYSPDGRLLAYSLNDGGVGLRDVKIDKDRPPLEAYGRQPRLLAFLPGGAELIAVYEGGALLRWDVAAHQSRALREAVYYSFAIQSLQGDKLVAPGDPRKTSKSALIFIARNGVIQRQQEVSLSSGPVRLLAKREVDRITFQVNDQPTLVLHDVLPYRPHDGFFGVYWPASVGLTQLRGRERPLPPAGSTLERAEELFARGEFRAALPLYEEHIRNAGKTDAAQKSRRQADCKAALCLLHMNRVEEAAHRLQQTFGEVGTENELWPALAGLTLWKIYLEQERFDKAELLFEALATRYPSTSTSPFTALITENESLKIIGIHQQKMNEHVTYSKAELNSFVVSQLEKFLSVTTFLRRRYIQSLYTFHLIQAYRVSGQKKKARESAGELLLIAQSASSIPSERIYTKGFWMSEIEAWGWLYRTYGDPRHWLRSIDTELFSAPGVLRALGPYRIQRLLIERCRTHWKLQEWKEAESDLKQFFQFVEKQAPNHFDSLYYSFATACLMQGFLCERSGDQAGAKAAWKHGLYSAWWNKLPPEVQKEKNREPTLDWEDQTPYCMVLGALCDTLTAEETALKAVTGDTWGDNIKPVLKEYLTEVDRISICREAWRSTLGRKFAHQIAFGEVVGAERYRCVPILVCFALLHQKAMPGELLPEQQNLLEELASKGWDAYCAGKLGAGGVQLLRHAWDGDTGYLGWGSLSRRLEPSLRGSFAYVLSHRYRRILGKPAEARTLMETALSDAAPDTPLHKLAKAELEELKSPSAPPKKDSRKGQP